MSLFSVRSEQNFGQLPRFDLVSTLILSAVFLATVFVIVQFYQHEEGSRNAALRTSNDRIAQLTEILAQEQGEKSKTEQQMSRLKATLATSEGERDRYKALSENLGSSVASAQDAVAKLSGELDAAKKNALDVSANIAELTKTLDQERAEKSKIDQQLTQLKTTLATLERERDRTKDLSENLGNKMASAQDTVAKLSDELEAAKKSALDANARVAQLTETLTQDQAEKAKLEQELAQLKATPTVPEGERDRTKDTPESLGNGTAPAQDTVAKLSEELNTAKKNADDANARAMQITETLVQEQTEKSKVEQLLAQLKTMLKTVEGERDQNKGLLMASEERERDAQSKIANLETQLSVALANASARRD